MKKLFGLLALTFSCSFLQAGMMEKLQDVFQSIGAHANGGGPSAFSDQQGGFYTGGSLFVRTPAQNTQILQMEMPELKVGCGGIDLFTGGFSYINSQQLIQTMRSIGSSAATYAFGLALQTVTPQIKAVLDELSAKMEKVNGLMINSCETSAALVGGLWPKTEASSRLLCQSMGAKSNAFADWAAARQGCGAEGKASQRINGHRPEGFQDMLGDNYNLTWEALRKNAFLGEDEEMAEFLMSIAGTIIVQNKGGRYQVTRIPATDSDEFLKVLLEGGTIQKGIHRCNDRQCLSPSLGTITISGSKSLIGQVGDKINQISEKLEGKKEGALSENERAFINATRLPILKILAVEQAYRQGGSPIKAKEFSEVIAFDILLNYIDSALSSVLDSLSKLQQSQMEPDTIENFKKDIHRNRRIILTKRNGLFHNLIAMLKMIEQTTLVEDKLHQVFLEGSE